MAKLVGVKGNKVVIELTKKELRVIELALSVLNAQHTNILNIMNTLLLHDGGERIKTAFEKQLEYLAFNSKLGDDITEILDKIEEVDSDDFAQDSEN